MGVSAFQAGAELTICGVAHILLHKISDTFWQLEEKRTRRVKEMTDEELRRLYVDRELVFVADEPDPAAHEAEIGEAYKNIPPETFELIKMRRAYVLAIIDLPSTAAVVRPIIGDIWRKIAQPVRPPGPTTVLEWKSWYIAGGRDIFSLVPRMARKGNRTLRFSEAVTDIVAEVIEAHYMTLERKTVQETLDWAIIRTTRENERRLTDCQLPLPTRWLVKRLIAAIPEFDKEVARHGRFKAMNRFRSVLRHRVTGAPLERAEIDHTPLDLMVVDDKTGLPLGRPYLTACIDDFTRCVLGIFISFEPPSYLTVARCLKDCFLPKVRLREDYPEVKNPWAAHGVMRELVVDNGAEFHSDSLEMACYSLGIEIHYAPRRTGWFKGKVERFLGSINLGVAHGIPGTTFSNVLEKEDYDPSKNAIIRLDALQRIIRVWIADYYHHKPHRGIDVTPDAKWASSIKPEDIPLPDDPARLDAILGRTERRILSHKGIELNGLLYNSPDLTKLRRSLGDRLAVEIRIDDADIGKIFVLCPDNKRIFEARCLSFEYADGLSRWQHKICRGFARRNIGDQNPITWLHAKEEIARIIEDQLANRPRKSAKKMARFQGNKRAQVLDSGSGVSASLAVPISAELSITHGKLVQSARRPNTPRKRLEPIMRDRTTSIYAADAGQKVTND